MIPVPKSYFLAVEGPIGVGKTTLARLLQPRLGANLVLEAFEENPFLSDFYGDRERYAFQTQMFFLLSRYRQHQSILSLVAEGPVISDYTFAKDNLFAHLNLDGEELKIYERLYTVLAERTVLPDLVVYLRADVDALMARIAARDRSYERKMDRDYIALVREAYEQHFDTYGRTPLLTLDTGDLNYVQDASALAFVEAEVKRALGIGAYQQPLPQMERSRVARVVEPPSREDHHAAGREALTEFVSANEAVARVGTLLAQASEGQSGGQASILQTALHDAIQHLTTIADSAGVDLKGPLREDIDRP